MSFIKIALPLADLGFPVVPLTDGKRCTLTSWETKATTDRQAIEAWGDEHPQANVGLVARGNVGDYCFFDDDIGDTMQQAARDSKQSIPHTRIHRTGSGKQHWVFRLTERAKYLGNCQAKTKRDGRMHEAWSFRAVNRYVVGPGSEHPDTHQLYTVESDAPIIDVPRWLLDWMECELGANDIRLRLPGHSSKMPQVHEDFDFDEFSEWLAEDCEVEITHSRGDWHHLSVCPFAGRKHRDAKGGAIYWDGLHLGFNGFAGGCDCSTSGIGGLLKHLYTEHEPYEGTIWRGDIDLDDVDAKWGEIRDITPLPAVEDEDDEYIDPAAAKDEDDGPSPPSAEAEIAAFIALSPDGTATAEERAASESRSSRRLGLASTVKSLAVAETDDAHPQSEQLAFPESALYGRLGEMSRRCEWIHGLTYPALLTLAAATIIEDEMCGVRMSLYACLLGGPGTGKDTAVNRARAVLQPPRAANVETGVTIGSDRGLFLSMRAVNTAAQKGPTKPEHCRICEICPQLETTLAKGRVEGSGPSLIHNLNIAYDQNDLRHRAKDGAWETDCRLSLLGYLTVKSLSQFRASFGNESQSGFYDRLIFGHAGAGREWNEWEPPAKDPLGPPPIEVPLDDEGDPSGGSLAACERQQERIAEITWKRGVDLKGYAAVTEFAPSAKEAIRRFAVEESVAEFGLLAKAWKRRALTTKKIAIILAAFNAETEVSEACARAAIAFCRWQLALRRAYSPGMGATAEAQVSEIILANYEELARTRGPSAAKTHYRVIYQQRNELAPYGPVLVRRVMDSLVKNGQLIPLYELVADDNGNMKPKVKNRHMLRLPTDTDRPYIARLVPSK